MPYSDTVALIHLVGFVTSLALYALLATMTVRVARTATATSGRIEGSRLALATALLGLVWNAGALVVYGQRDLGLGPPAPWLSAPAFAALGFLPAVVVHAALRGLGGPTAPAYIVTGYLVATASALVHAAAAAQGAQLPARPALLLMTAGFGLLMGGLAVQRKRFGGRRTLTAVALAVFAVSSLHLADHPEAGESWIAALLGHHGSLPLAFAILYQDYRFALVDAFLKRALSLVALVALAVALYLLVALPVIAAAPPGADDARRVGVLIALWVATALVYPAMRRGVDRLVDHLLLRRTDYRVVRARLAERIAMAGSAELVLDAVCGTLAPALTASAVTWRADQRGRAATDPVAELSAHGTNGARLHVPTAELPGYLIEIGPLSGGRRLLSDDLVLLESVALVAGRRLDALRVANERFERDVREAQMGQLATEAELRALRAQINPHFLFNTLNTLGYLMRTAPERAQGTLYHLTDLLRAVLHRSEREHCTLGEEVELVESYLAIEAARFEERLRVHIDVPASLHGIRLPPLLLQPLVENAVKHGIAPSRTGGEISISARIADHAPVAAGDGEKMLHLIVRDSGSGSTTERLTQGRARGVGLANVERRLERHFGERAALTLSTTPREGTAAELWIPVVIRTGARVEPVDMGADARGTSSVIR